MPKYKKRKIVRKDLLTCLTCQNVWDRLKDLFMMPFDKGIAYNGKLSKKIIFDNSSEKNKILCIFAHYDKHKIIDDYVLTYLIGLKTLNVDLMFVSTSDLPDQEINKLKNICRIAFVKENVGYDFGAWKTVLEFLEFDGYESLILCNDSVYAPLYDFQKIFDRMKLRGLDFWGITDNFEVSYHIQSYFMVFNRKIVESDIFNKLWETYKVYKIKRNIIRHYEIGLTQLLLRNGFEIGAYCEYEKFNEIIVKNSTHYFWEDLITEFDSPIIKVELLRDNPGRINIAHWEKVLCKTGYDTTIIKKHLDRMHDSKRK